MKRPHIRSKPLAIAVGVGALVVAVCAFDDAYATGKRPLWARLIAPA